MTGYDLFAILVILISAFAGWVRGGAREVISFFSFVLAALIALIGLPVTGPLGRDILDPDWIGTVAAGVLTFVLVYVGVRLLGKWVGRSLRENQHLSGFDRAFGGLFGLVRALVLLSVIHLVFHAVTPPERVPGWFRDAAVFPVSAAGARVIQAVLPGIGRAADSVTPVVVDSARRGASDETQSDATSPPPPSGF